MLSGESRNQIFQQWCYAHGLSINCSWMHGIAVATNRHDTPWREQLPKSPETWTESDWTTFQELAKTHLVECDLALASEVKDRKQFLTDYDLKRLLWDQRRFSRIVRESRPGMSERRTVMLDANSNKLTGTLFYVPVYEAAMTDFLAGEGLTRNERASARWMHLTSVILAPVDFTELVNSVWAGSPSDLGIELFSSTNQTADTWLNISEGQPRAADPEFKAYLTQRHRWPMYGSRFSIFFYTTGQFEAQSPRRLAKIAMAAGVILTLLATALVGLAFRARRQQEQMTEQIREARDALAIAHRERQNLSRDLHDGTIQSLYAIQLGLGHTVQKLEAEPANARREFAAVRRELDVVIAEIRQFITTEAGPGKAVDFSAVLQALVQRASTGTTARITSQCTPVASQRLTGDQAVQLANIAREALSNSLRHARPQHVDITLCSKGEMVVLEISDDGNGFDPMAPGRSGVGLTSMMERAREMDGAMEIQSAPGKGTRVVVRVPGTRAEPVTAEWSDESADES
jgi:signal transduction histidine kinase